MKIERIEENKGRDTSGTNSLRRSKKSENYSGVLRSLSKVGEQKRGGGAETGFRGECWSCQPTAGRGGVQQKDRGKVVGCPERPNLGGGKVAQNYKRKEGKTLWKRRGVVKQRKRVRE